MARSDSARGNVTEWDQMTTRRKRISVCSEEVQLHKGVEEKVNIATGFIVVILVMILLLFWNYCYVMWHDSRNNCEIIIIHTRIFILIVWVEPGTCQQTSKERLKTRFISKQMYWWVSGFNCKGWKPIRYFSSVSTYSYKSSLNNLETQGSVYLWRMATKGWY